MLWNKNVLYGNPKLWGVKSVIEKRNEIDARKEKPSYHLREEYVKESRYNTNYYNKKTHARKDAKKDAIFRFKNRKWLKAIKAETDECPF